MYEARKSERKILVEPPYNYTSEEIDWLDAESDKARKGIPINIRVVAAVCDYQSKLQAIKKNRKWWHFWA